MGRYSLNVRSIYDKNEPTFGEGLARGVQSGLDWYASEREKARQEGNTVRSQGGVRQPDEARPGIRQRIRGVGAALGDLVHGRAPGPPDLQPTGPFVAQQGGAMAGVAPGPAHTDPSGWSEQMPPGVGNADDMVTDAIMGRPYGVVRPTGPVDALPASPRPMPGGPMLYDGTTIPPEREYTYEGADGKYTVPQAGERERVNRMLEYGTQAQVKEGADVRNDARTADRAEAHDERIARIYAGRDDVRGQQQAAHDLRVGQLRERIARLTGAGRGNSPEALSIRRQLADLAERKEERLANEGVARVEAQTAATEQKAVVTSPRDKRIINRDPQQKAANDQRQGDVDSALKRSREAANRVRNSRASVTMQRQRAQELKSMGLSKDAALAQMQAEGYRVSR
jgi:hypothetical protein